MDHLSLFAAMRQSVAQRYLCASLIAFGMAGSPSAWAQSARTIDDPALKNAAKSGDDWTTYGFTQGETRYSPLQQINTSNVQRLGLAWSYDVGRGG